MLQLTDTAKSKLLNSLAAARMPDHEGKCYRIVPKDDRFLTLTLARPAPSDSVVKHDGNAILAVPKALHPFFDDKSLDIDEDGKLKLS
jgi:hypothetical protein